METIKHSSASMITWESCLSLEWSKLFKGKVYVLEIDAEDGSRVLSRIDEIIKIGEEYWYKEDNWSMFYPLKKDDKIVIID